MKKIIIITIIIALIIIAFSIISSINSSFDNDELWQKAQVLAENSYRLIPGKRTITTETITDGNVDTSSESTTVYTFHRDENGDIVTEVEKKFDLAELLSQLNLNDQTDHDSTHSLTQNSNVRIMSFNSMDEIPDLSSLGDVQVLGDTDVSFEFDMTPKKEGVLFENDKNKLTLRKMRGTKNMEGRQAQGYSFKFTATGRKNDKQNGVMWLDTETGAPIMQEIGSAGLSLKKGNKTLSYYGFDKELNMFFTEKEIDEKSISVPLVGINLKIISTTIDEDHWL